MNDHQKLYVSGMILRVVQELQRQADEWVPLSAVSVPLAEAGIRPKAYGCSKLRTFLFQFQEILEFREESSDGKSYVCFVRPQAEAINSFAAIQDSSAELEPPENQRPGFPEENAQLFSWASIPSAQIRALADMVLEEPWSFGKDQTPGQLPILRNYLAHTFRRLCCERKVRLATDPIRNEEYAAFNTGLVDQKYDPIHALFRHDVRYGTQYWYLLAFVVAGEDLGKKLVNLFNPLPAKADYFEGKFDKRFFDTSSGDLLCGYTHILTERLYRLPLAFLQKNCPSDLLYVDGVGIEDFYYTPFDAEKQNFFLEMGKQIRRQSRAFNQLRNRLESAVNFSHKQVKWNPNIATPMYDPMKNQVSFLLPLALTDEETVDLALVVERQLSGAYQGQTILPLDFAYKTARTIAPISISWLQADAVTMNTSDNQDSTF